jgi:hypothetical protein
LYMYIQYIHEYAFSALQYAMSLSCTLPSTVFEDACMRVRAPVRMHTYLMVQSCDHFLIDGRDMCAFQSFVQS